jgi:hypothetical protein
MQTCSLHVTCAVDALSLGFVATVRGRAHGPVMASASQVASERSLLRLHPSTRSASRSNGFASRRSSDYLVLSRLDSHNEEISLPRPKVWYLLPLFGALDAAYTIAASTFWGVQGRNEIAMVVWGLIRAVLVMLATSHTRVREIGWIIVGSAFVSLQRNSSLCQFYLTHLLQISALAALAELNLIIQRQAWTSTIPATLALYCFSHAFFGLLHWLAFAAIVGVTRERNPYGLGLHSVRRRPGAWREGVTNLQEARGTLREGDECDEEEGEDGVVDGNADDWADRLRRKRNALEDSFLSEDEDMLHSEESEDEDDIPIDATRDFNDYLDDDGDDDHDAEDEDDYEDMNGGEYMGSPPRANDIIDIIPSPSTATGTRHRAISTSRSLRSRRSFYARASHGGSPEDGLLPDHFTSEPSPISLTSGYGTFRSLAGI